MAELKELQDLTGRVALITGGAGHLGRAMAAALIEQGARVVLTDREADSCHQAAEALCRLQGDCAAALACDLAEEAALKGLPAMVLREHGRLDVLVNNAAYVGTSDLEGWVVPFAEQSPAAWRQALEVNLTAPFVLSQACAPALADSGRGSIINIASIYGILGPDHRLYDGTAMGNPAAYGASKGGLIQLTRYLATTLAPRVRVNSITLGGVWRGQPQAFVERYTDRTPLKRMAVEDDIKGAAAFLASDASSYLTGHNLILDGGFSAW